MQYIPKKHQHFLDPTCWRWIGSDDFPFQLVDFLGFNMLDFPGWFYAKEMVGKKMCGCHGVPMAVVPSCPDEASVNRAQCHQHFVVEFTGDTVDGSEIRLTSWGW